jgi:hypothetical protein
LPDYLDAAEADPQGGVISARRRFSILNAVNDANLFAPWFRDQATWQSWFAFLAALFALPLTADQFAIYQQCTGRTEPPTAPASEGWLICGRRAGKSFVLALVAVRLSRRVSQLPAISRAGRARHHHGDRL